MEKHHKDHVYADHTENSVTHYKKNIHLRKPAKPIGRAQQIYKATGCKHTQKAIRKYVAYH